MNPRIPRKIEFESAVYLREGIIDRIFPSSPVTILFIGDAISDKRFSYNCDRLFKTFGDRYRIYSFICNASLLERPFARSGPPMPGWDHTNTGDRLFYHATDWSELDEFRTVAERSIAVGVHGVSGS